MFPEYSFKKYQFYCYTLYVVCYRPTMYKVNTPMMNPTKYYLVNCSFHSINFKDNSKYNYCPLTFHSCDFK